MGENRQLTNAKSAKNDEFYTQYAKSTYTNGTDTITEFYDYDMFGNRIVTTDALGHAIYKSYDSFGRVTAEWGATCPVCYAYDTQGRRTSLATTRDGDTWDTTTWAYDAPTGLCTSKTYADGSSVTYTYTSDNLLLRTTYASGRWKENEYDDARRLCGVSYSAPEMAYTILLDAYGNPTNVHDAVGNIWRHVYGSDSKLLVEERIALGEGDDGATTNSLFRGYDPNGRPDGFTFSRNGIEKECLGYVYDNKARIAHIAATNAAGRAFSVTYTNDAGYCHGYTLLLPNGGAIHRVVTRDDFRRHLVMNCGTFFNSSPVDSHAYAFDALSRPTTRSSSGMDGMEPLNATFTYNDKSEILTAAIGTNLFVHSYDHIGNHVSFVANAITNTFAHTQMNQICGSDDAPQMAFDYTSDGGLSSDGTWHYVYDAEDQLVSATSSSLTNGAIRVLNAYDYLHRQISTTVQRLSVVSAQPPSPPIETYRWDTIENRTFAYDGWNLIHETICAVDGESTNTTEVQYFWGLDLSGSLQGAGGVGGLLAVSRDGQFFFPAFDNNGNVMKYVDEGGAVVAAYEYDDFGRQTSQSGSLADFFRLRFSTKYYDSETGLYYYGYRFYAPKWRIWLNRDPIGEDVGVNLYAFCGNNGMKRYDLLGREPNDGEEKKKSSTSVRVTFYFDAWCLLAKGVGSVNKVFGGSSHPSGKIKVKCGGGKLIVRLFPYIGYPPEVGPPAKLPEITNPLGRGMISAHSFPKENRTGVSESDLFGKATPDGYEGNNWFKWSLYSYPEALFDIAFNFTRSGTGDTGTYEKLFTRWTTMFHETASRDGSFDFGNLESCEEIEVNMGNHSDYDFRATFVVEDAE